MFDIVLSPCNVDFSVIQRVDHIIVVSVSFRECVRVCFFVDFHPSFDVCARASQCESSGIPPARDFGSSTRRTVLPGRQENWTMSRQQQQQLQQQYQQQQQQQITTSSSSQLQRSISRTEQHVTRQFTQTTQRQGSTLYIPASDTHAHAISAESILCFIHSNCMKVRRISRRCRRTHRYRDKCRFRCYPLGVNLIN